MLDDIRMEGRYRKLNIPPVYEKGGMGVDLSSNDYLGIAGREDWRREFLEMAVDRVDLRFSASSSRLLTGNHFSYVGLESLLSDSYQTQTALVFNSGYHMNSGILPALCVGKTLILADKWVHASIIDGMRLSSADCIRFRHQDLKQLERLLENKTSGYDTVWVVCESIYSMSGDICDLNSLVELKHRYKNVFLYLDEAHAVGVRGRRGLGLAEEKGLIPEIDMLCGTFGKALASLGGFVVCSSVFREVLIQRMRPLIFTTALPALNVEWTAFVWKKMMRCEKERYHLEELSAKLYQVLHGENPGEGRDWDGGYESERKLFRGKNSDWSHIQMWTAGNSPDALELSFGLQKNGFGVMAVRPPTVPESFSGVRFSLRADLPELDWDRLFSLRKRWKMTGGIAALENGEEYGVKFEKEGEL